ncbi:MAG: hypothetical protein JWQ89_2664 [Devosia sp.]|uniref:plastocyanin/azurin family copper-binding protein n=1 Tax=Devosia sp. TaxID=1871048 RepID=UPI00260E8298|nr:plastocyanin/azurin family copper-binding protein [Devosia sp.]MDB5540937.1 hypothetical protein [Devosia sp.]
MLKISKQIGVLATTLALTALATAAALSAPSVIVVTLADGADAGMATDMAMPADMAGPPMTITASSDKIGPGEVTFSVANQSSELIHEMIVATVRDPSAPLSYIDADFQVDEDAIQVLGEVPDLEPGKSGELTLALDPGTYVLFCNMPGHYKAGMWATITVE